MKLLGYILSGNTVGVDLDTWEVNDLSGNNPFLKIEDDDSIPSGYTDISSIMTWGIYGENTDFNFNQVRDVLLKIKPTSYSGLTQQEIDILDDYQLKKYFLIYDFIEYNINNIDGLKPTTNLDYDILGLKKKRFFDKGELYKVEYYGNYDDTGKTYSNLCIAENRVYYRQDRFLSKRVMDITWYYNDGTSGYTKTTNKYYNTNEGIQAGEIRRSNVISNLKITVVGLIMMSSGVTSVEAQSLGRPFINSYSTEISKFIQGFEYELRNSIAADTIYDWLDLAIPNTGGITIRQYLIGELTIDYTINNTDT